MTADMTASHTLTLANSAAIVDVLAGDPPVAPPFTGLALDKSGQFHRVARDRVAFSFVFGGALFEAAGKVQHNNLDLSLHANLGPLPFSAESTAARQAVLSMVNQNDLPHGRFVLTEAQTIRLDGRLTVLQPVTPVTVLAGIAGFLLDFRPHIDRLAGYLAQAFPTYRTSLPLPLPDNV